MHGAIVTVEVVLLLLAYISGWVMTLLGLPGNWLIVVAVGLYVALGPASSRVSIGWPMFVAIVGIAILGEAVESLAGALGAQRAGGSRRCMLLAIVTSFPGAIIGAGAGIPIPVIGSAIGAVVGAALGAMVGTIAGELWKGRALEHGWRVGEAAFWGRIVGTLAKLICASAMVAVGVLALVL